MELDDLLMFDRWQDLLEQFDAGDREPLAATLRSGERMPDFAREAVADIVAGTRKPARGKGRQRLTPAHRRTVERAVLNHAILLLAATDGTLKANGPDMKPGELRSLRAGDRGARIDRVVEITGLERSTVERAWRSAWRKWDAIARKQGDNRRIAQLRKLASKNRLF